MDKGNYNDAIKAFEGSLKQPETPQQGFPTQEEANRFTVPKTTDSMALYGMGYAYDKSGHKDKAIEFYQGALDADPENEDAYKALAYYAHKAGDKEVSKLLTNKAGEIVNKKQQASDIAKNLQEMDVIEQQKQQYNKDVVGLADFLISGKLDEDHKQQINPLVARIISPGYNVRDFIEKGEQSLKGGAEKIQDAYYGYKEGELDKKTTAAKALNGVVEMGFGVMRGLNPLAFSAFDVAIDGANTVLPESIVNMVMAPATSILNKVVESNDQSQFQKEIASIGDVIANLYLLKKGEKAIGKISDKFIKNEPLESSEAKEIIETVKDATPEEIKKSSEEVASIKNIENEIPSTTPTEATPEAVPMPKTKEGEIVELGDKIVDNILKSDINGEDMYKIQTKTLSLKEEENLYNTDQEYRELMDADEKGTLDAKGKERLSEIFRSEVLKKQVKKISELYEKAKADGSNPELVKAVEDVIAKPKEISAQEKAVPFENRPSMNFPERMRQLKTDTKHILSKDAASIRQAVLHFFLKNGKINTEDLIKETGFGRKGEDGKVQGKTDFQQRKWMHDKDGTGIDDMIESVGEIMGRELTDKEKGTVRDETIDVLNSHGTKSSMVGEAIRTLEKPDRGQYSDVSDEELKRLSDEQDALEKEYNDLDSEQMDKIAQEYDEWYNSLPLDEQNKEIELTHNENEPKSNKGTEGVPDVADKEATEGTGGAKEPAEPTPTAGEAKITPPTHEELKARLASAKEELALAKLDYDKAAKALSKDLNAKQGDMFAGNEQKLFNDEAEINAEVVERKKILDIKKEEVDKIQKQLDDTLEGQQAIEFEEKQKRDEVMKGLDAKAKELQRKLDKPEPPTENKSDTDNIVKAKFLPIKEVIQAAFKPLNKIQEKLFGEQVDKVKEWAAKQVKKANQSSSLIKRWTGQFITSWNNGIPRTLKDLQEKRLLKGNVQLSNVKFAEGLKKLHELVGNNVESLERIHQVLDPEFYDSNPTLFGKKVELKDLTPNEKALYDTLKDVNEYVHDWNFGNGLIDLKTYMNNKGKYIARMYDAFEIPEDAQTFLENNELPIGNKRVKLITDIFKARTELNKWKEQHVIRDPVFITLKRMMQTDVNASVLSYIEHIAKERGMVSVEPKAGFTQLNGKGYGKLNGAYVPNYIAEDFQGYFFGNQLVDLLYDAAKVYDRTQLRQFYKKFHTVFNPAVQLGNNSSNFVFSFLSGIDPVTMASKYPSAIKELKAKGDTYKLLVKNGILGSDVITGDLRPLTQRTEAIAKETDKIKKSFIDKVSKADKKITDLYSGSDDVAKLSAFMSLKEYGYSDAKAIELVYNGFQNYSTVGKIWDLAAKTPVIGNAYVKFQADLQRIVANAALRRPLSTAMFIGLLNAIATIGSKSVGESDEEKEIREGRKFIPKIKLPEKFGGDAPLVVQSPVGEINLARYLSPYYIYDTGDMQSPIDDITKYMPYQVKMLEGREMGDKDVSMPKQDPLIGPWWAAIVDDVDFRGMSVQDPTATRYRASGATNTEKILNAVNYIARSQVPFYSSVKDMQTAWSYGTDFYGRDKSPMQTILSNFIKIQDFKGTKYAEVIENDLNNIEYTITGYETKLKDIEKTLAKEDEKYQKLLEDKKITPEQYQTKAKELEITYNQRSLPVIEKIAEQQDKMNQIVTKYANILK